MTEKVKQQPGNQVKQNRLAADLFTFFPFCSE